MNVERTSTTTSTHASTSSTLVRDGNRSLECADRLALWDERKRKGASMIGGRNLTAAVLTSLAVFVSSAPAQQRGVGSAPAASTLTAQDYAEIQQLSNRYGWAIDACTNAGYDFADLF